MVKYNTNIMNNNNESQRIPKMQKKETMRVAAVMMMMIVMVGTAHGFTAHQRQQHRPNLIAVPHLQHQQQQHLLLSPLSSLLLYPGSKLVAPLYMRPNKVDALQQQPLLQDSSPTTAPGRSRIDLSATSIGNDQTSSMFDSASSQNSMTNGSSTMGGAIPTPSFVEADLIPVLSTALLITSNTVGAGMLVLPELAAQPGMGLSLMVFGVVYIMNFLSGLTIAQVAITQRERNGGDVPSSFKEFAELSLKHPWATNISAFLSVWKNALVLAFGTVKAGQVTAQIVHGDPFIMSIVWAAFFIGLVSTQTAQNLSKVASVFVMLLFASCAGLLIPGLSAIQDPLAILTAPGTAADPIASLGTVAPVLLMSLVFQNIVPTATRVLDYDRTKVTIAVGLGSFLPLCLYVAWCVAVLGGGIDTTAISSGGALSNPLWTIFSVVTIAGSSLGCSTSMSEEFDTFWNNNNNNSGSDNQQQRQRPNKTTTVNEVVDDTTPKKQKEKFSLPAVMASVGVSWMLGQCFTNDLTDALKLAGSYGTPLLYGAMPVLMAYVQYQQQQQQNNDTEQKDLVPGGKASLGLLGAASLGLVGVHLWENIEHLMSAASTTSAIMM